MGTNVELGDRREEGTAANVVIGYTATPVGVSDNQQTGEQGSSKIDIDPVIDVVVPEVVIYISPFARTGENK